MGKKKLRFVIGGVVIVVAVVALVAFAMTKNSVFYYTVNEVMAKGQSENVRVSGDLVRGTIQKGNIGDPITFKIQDKTATDKVITVTYTGNVPDTFREPRPEDPTPEVIVEGDYNASTNHFNATFLLAKCPSKYEAQAKQSDVTSTTTVGTPTTSN
jgi:cytochrome c-type biogenesis protein CcmE